jgi:hypothetical protein
MAIDSTSGVSRDPVGLEEYRALRATIRERGSLRFLVTSITFSAWAAVLTTLCAVTVVPAFILIPLALLAAGFELNLAIHVGVERVGRYLQLKYERDHQSAAGWEHAVMKLEVPRGGVDALFLAIFFSTLALNFVVALWLAAAITGPDEIGAIRIETLVVAVLHAIVAARWLQAAKYARSQRDRELAAFEAALKP